MAPNASDARKMKGILLAVAIASISCVGGDKKRADGTAPITGKTTVVHREIVTPSGDWAGGIDYHYGQDGDLRHLSFEFRTLAGYDSDSEAFKPTRCLREYDVSETGKLVLRSTETTDLDTGQPVDRQFYEPEIAHWMTLAEARAERRAELIR